MGKQKSRITRKVKSKVKQKVKQKLILKPVIVHHMGVGLTQLECPYGASEVFATAGLAMKIKKRHEQKMRHRRRLCRLFKGM